MPFVRWERNPLIAPRPGFEWEHRGTFNPGAIESDNQIHLLYRAVDSSGVSRLGYASASDGFDLTFRSPAPVFSPTLPEEEFGCEDPRITQLEDEFYITYTAYSRAGQRIGLASTTDFVSFKKLGLIGPDVDDKDCVLFPELVNGRIAMLHRVESRIQIAYFKDLAELQDKTILKSVWGSYINHVDGDTLLKGEQPWETWKVGAGPPPVKISKGWLLIYHGVSANRVYSAGAVLLDLKNPSVVLSRTMNPILVPETVYEKEGVVPNVVFPCGMVVRGETLIVYYGGADTVCGAASIRLSDLLELLS